MSDEVNKAVKLMGRTKQKSNTVSITLRLDVDLLSSYEKATARANQMYVAAGKRGNLTVQQLILHRLRSLPLISCRHK